LAGRRVLVPEIAGFESPPPSSRGGAAEATHKSPQLPTTPGPNHPFRLHPVKTSSPMPRDRRPVGATRRGLRVLSGSRGRPNGHRRPNACPAVKKEEIDLYGRRVAYRTGGSGPLLVLIHGITSSSATWDRVLPGLARRFTVIAPDLLGHGRSDKLRGDYSVGAHANTIRDLLDALGHDAASFVGHSLGGGVALQFAYQYPERIDRLVLVAPGGFGREVTLLLRAASVPGSGPVLALVAWRPIVQAGTLLTQTLGRVGVHGNTDLEEIGRSYASLADRDSRRAFIHTLRSVVDYEGQRVSALNRIGTAHGIPLLMVWGECDRVVPARQGMNVHQLMPHIQLKVFKHGGHFPHRDDPIRFVRVIDAFLARASSKHRRRAAVGA
jgi:pimeloyl-ACP methyl ester carboxylesterase